MRIQSLRVGINFGNVVLATRDSAGSPQGIAVALARELARRLAVPLEMVCYDAAGKMADGARAGEWDVAFLAADPDRATEILFSPPYLQVDTTYLVPASSALRSVDDVDREGIRISLSRNSAYDLFLTRSLKNAQLVRAPGPEASVTLFLEEKLEALAGLRPWLAGITAKHPGTRLLDGRFYTVQQAIGTRRGEDELARHVRAFVEDAKASGLAAQLIAAGGIPGVSAAP